MYKSSAVGISIFFFLHDRSWISPWKKSISKELDIIIHVIASQLSGYCDVINNRLWRHQQNVNLASEARGWCVKIVVSIVIFFATPAIDTKITLSWALKQFVTRVPTLFYIYILLADCVIHLPIFFKYASLVFGHCYVWRSSSDVTWRICPHR